jgi:hypothetical protein
MLSRAPLALVGLAFCFAACSSETVNVGEENNADNNAQNNAGANNAQSNNAQANNGDNSAANNSAVNNSAVNNADNSATNNSDNSATNNSDNSAQNNSAQNNDGTPDANSDGPLCGAQLAFYADEDGDSYGDEGVQECGDAAPEGFAARAGDCALGDASVNPGADEVCNDNVDDDCQGGDAVCPTTQGNGVDVPAWNCEDEQPPSNVYAWARFEQDQPYFQAGGCFVFFEGLEGEFYVKHNLQRANNSADCASINGCTCPSLNGWPSYDRRLYAFTQDTDLEGCEEIEIIDHGGEDQPVSNACRKYLYQLHYYDIPYSYIATGADALERRLSVFETVEVACAHDAPHRNLPYQTLMSARVVRNGDFESK